MSEQEKWKEEARKEADSLYITRPVKIAYIQGYLQACKVMQEEIERIYKTDRFCPFCQRQLRWGDLEGAK